MIKKFFILWTVILMILSVHAYGFTAGDYQSEIELNGIKIQADAYIDGGNVYLPLRAVGEALGYKIDWSEKDHTITVFKPGKNIIIDLKSNKITANDHIYYMSGDYSGNTANCGTIVGNRTYMRADFFSDNFGLKVVPDRQNGKVKLESKDENAISIKTVKEASETEKIKITIQYPQIDGLDDKTIQDSINSIFKKSAMDAGKEGLQNADDIAKNAAGYTGSPIKCEIYFDYRVKYNQNGLLSVVFTNYQYTGGAHGFTVQSSHTFNLKTGEEYKLKDLFNSTSDYVSYISSIVRDQINDMINEKKLSESSITRFKSIKEEQNFYLSNNAVIIYFQEYEYFSYAAGIQEFPVDISALKDMLKPDLSFLSDESKLIESSGTPNSLDVGETGKIILKGNPTTGYTWHYTIENKDIVKLDSENDVRDTDMIGAGNTYTWNFKALKAGQTRLTFKYYRDWEGEASTTASNTIEYLICVNPSSPSNGNAPFYGSKVAYAAEDGLYCANMDDGKAVVLVKGTGISTPVFSGDGKTVAFMQGGTLYAYDFVTSKAQMMLKEADSYCPGPNGEFYASSQKTGIAVVNPHTAESSTIIPAERDTSYIHLKLSPDSKLLAYDSVVSGVENQDRGGTWLYDTTSKKMQMIVKAIKMTDTSILTNDDTYRSEAPVFLKNNDIVFARVNANGEKSVWLMDSDGNNQKMLARWKYRDPNDSRFTDFYGRIDWNIMFAVFDNTKMDYGS